MISRLGSSARWALMVLLLAGCTETLFGGKIYVMHAPDLAAISDPIAIGIIERTARGIAMPKTAHDISVASAVGRDRDNYVVFTASRDEIETFAEEYSGKAFDMLPYKCPPVLSHNFSSDNQILPRKFVRLLAPAQKIGNGAYFEGQGYGFAIDLERSVVYLYR